MKPQSTALLATLDALARFQFEEEKDAAKLSRLASEHILLNPALIAGDDIKLSLEQLVGRLAHEMRCQPQATHKFLLQFRPPTPACTPP